MVRQGKHKLTAAVLLLLAFLVSGCDKPDTTGHLTYPLDPTVEDCLLRTGTVADFEALYRSLYSVEEPADCHFWVGLVALAAGNMTECETRMRTAISLGVSGIRRSVAEMSLGDVALSKGDPSAAKAAYEPLLEKAGGQLRYMLLARLTALYFRNGESDKAGRYFYDWQNEYPALTAGFPSAKSVAERVYSDLSPGELFALQAGFFTDRALAETVVEKVKGYGFEVRIQSVNGGHKVIIGPFKGRAVALEAADRLRAKGVDSFLRSWSDE